MTKEIDRITDAKRVRPNAHDDNKTENQQTDEETTREKENIRRRQLFYRLNSNAILRIVISSLYFFGHDHDTWHKFIFKRVQFHG